MIRKRKGFNTSYYKKNKKIPNSENKPHQKVKDDIAKILRNEYNFKVITNYKDPDGYLMAPTRQKNIEPKPYELDILAWNEYLNKIFTIEIQGRYHFTNTQIKKDEIRKDIIKSWITNHFIQKIKWKAKTVIVHKHIAISKTDVIKKFLNHDTMASQYFGLEPSSINGGDEGKNIVTDTTVLM